MLRNTPLLLTLPLLLGVGLIEGWWTGRWTDSDRLEAAAARLRQVPLQVGPWQGSDQPIDPVALRSGEIDGYVLRDYVHVRTGKTLSVLVICGRPGPTCVHTPDVCYRGAGYKVVDGPARWQAGSPDLPGLSAMNFATFAKDRAADPERLRVGWAWSASGDWQAPAYPRWTFASHPALYKLYVARTVSELEPAPPADDDAVEFLQDFLPELNRSLFDTAREGAGPG